jgi:hypothetical protein
MKTIFNKPIKKCDLFIYLFIFIYFILMVSQSLIRILFVSIINIYIYNTVDLKMKLFTYLKLKIRWVITMNGMKFITKENPTSKCCMKKNSILWKEYQKTYK